MKTKNNSKLSERIYNALNENAKFSNRDYNIEANHFENKPKTITNNFWEKEGISSGNILDFKEFIEYSTNNNSKYSNFLERRIELNRHELEAMVLIPEEEKMAIVERISYHNPENFRKGKGFLTPKYTEKGLNSLISALARKFSDQDYLAKKTTLLQIWKKTLPESFEELSKYGEQIIKGINNANFGMHGEEHVEIDNLAYFLSEMGFNGKNTEIIKPLWNIAKQSPRGEVGKNTWELMGDYLIENNP